MISELHSTTTTIFAFLGRIVPCQATLEQPGLQQSGSLRATTSLRWLVHRFSCGVVQGGSAATYALPAIGSASTAASLTAPLLSYAPLHTPPVVLAGTAPVPRIDTESESPQQEQPRQQQQLHQSGRGHQQPQEASIKPAKAKASSADMSLGYVPDSTTATSPKGQMAMPAGKPHTASKSTIWASNLASDGTVPQSTNVQRQRPHRGSTAAIRSDAQDSFGQKLSSLTAPSLTTSSPPSAATLSGDSRPERLVTSPLPPLPLGASGFSGKLRAGARQSTSDSSSGGGGDDASDYGPLGPLG